MSFLLSRSGVNQLSNLLINSVEALLFGSGRPIRLSEIKNILENSGIRAELSEIKQAINNLEERYLNTSIEVQEVASGYRLQIKKETQCKFKCFME